MSKRGKLQNISRFRKGWIKSPLAFAVASVMLSGCSRSEKVVVVKDVDECVAKTSLDYNQCEVAYQKALTEAERTAPRFNNINDCAAQFGQDNCQRSSGGFFIPFMAGWMVSSVVDSLSSHSRYGYHYNPVFEHYNRDRGRGYYTAGGSRLSTVGDGYMSAPKSSVSDKQPRGKVYRTASRGGWGSTASAKSSWGGGGKSGGWGG